MLEARWAPQPLLTSANPRPSLAPRLQHCMMRYMASQRPTDLLQIVGRFTCPPPPPGSAGAAGADGRPPLHDLLLPIAVSALID